ncbi:ribonuclease III [Pseudohyphozyma bogoriensis]|nr:ribonuclease III [Pseudohyphozyma bogoriensis]
MATTHPAYHDPRGQQPGEYSGRSDTSPGYAHPSPPSASSSRSLPLSPPLQNLQFAPSQYTNGAPPPVASSSLSPGSSTSGSPSISRDSRPASLYIPMHDGSPAGSGNTPTWPFKKLDNANDDVFVELAPSPHIPFPYSPSHINPNFAVPPPTPPGNGGRHSPRFAHLVDDEDSEPPVSPIRDSLNVYGGHYPPTTRSRSPAASAAAAAAAAAAASASPSNPVHIGPPKLRSSNASEWDPRHHSSHHSLGTHALLSSRTTSLSARLAKLIDTPTSWLVMYFAFNLGLTLYNKLVLQGFPFPWTLTGIQMLAGTIGTQIALSRGYFVQATLNSREGWIMIAFSSLYTINIAVSNLSLHLVTVPFHQVVRAMTPLFIIVLSIIFIGKRYSRNTYLSLLPVVLGVVFATYGDYRWTMWGMILTLLGTLLAALKTLATNRLLVGRLKVHPLDLLIRMSPLAFMQCVLWGWWSGELEKVRVYGATEMTRGKAIALFTNGVIAFGLNVVSFTANKKTSALTMTVAANVKQVLTIILAVIIFNLTLNATNLLGICLTLAGGACSAPLPPSLSTLPLTLSNLLTTLFATPPHSYTSSLLVTPTKTWVLYLDVLLLSSTSGNLIDCAIIAARSALSVVRLPKTTAIAYEDQSAGLGNQEAGISGLVKGGKAGVAVGDFELVDGGWGEGDRMGGWKELPVAIGVGLVNQAPFLDPTALEEAATPSTLIAGFTPAGDLCAFVQVGEGEIEMARIGTLEAKEVALELIGGLNEKLKDA